MLVPKLEEMKVAAVSLVLVAVFAVGAGCSKEDPRATSRPTNLSRLARERLDRLAECGIRLNPGVRPDELLAGFDPAEPAPDQYLALLAAMGSPLDREPHPFPSDAVFTLEPEGIEKRGDYAFLARRLRTIARGKLPLSKVEDYVSLSKKKAWVAFDLGKRRYKWDARVRGRRVDQDILQRFADLLKRKNSEVRFLSVPLGSGVVLIGCATNREMRCLRDLGVPARWL